MKLFLSASSAMAFAVLSSGVLAQSLAPSPSPSATAAPIQSANPSSPTTATIVTPVAPTMSVLRAGASVPLKLMEELTTKGKNLRVGQRFQMEVSDNVMFGTNVIIPIGSPAMGEITDVRNKGMWGKSGKINARALY
ncbi:MAG: hypothetical protein ABI395_08220, partial [Sphingobium sp.]